MFLALSIAATAASIAPRANAAEVNESTTAAVLAPAKTADAPKFAACEMLAQ